MTTPVPPAACSFPDRERLALLDATGRLEGHDLARWDAHLASCAACAERAARDAADDAALAALAADEGAATSAAQGRHALPTTVAADDERAATRRRRRRWVVATAAAAAVVLAWPLAAGWSMRGRARPDDPRARAFRAAVTLSEAGRHEEALAAYRALLADRPEYGVRFLEGHALLHVGRAEEAVTAFRAALASRVSPSPDGQTAPRWYVQGHLAQALIAAAPDARNDAEVERIVREDMVAPGVGASLNRCYVWTLLARARAFERGDVAGGEDAVAAAERENLVHRRESARAGNADLDCHYVLQARFAFAEAVRADSDAGRRAAADLREVNERTAERIADPTRGASFLAEAVEYEALAELLAARRGDAADLARARTGLLDALAHRERAGNPEGRARTRTRLAWLDLMDGRPLDAVATASAAEEDALRSGAPEALLDARLLRAQALLAANRPVEALEAVSSARATPGAREQGHSLVIASVEARVGPDAETRARARATVAAATSSSLRDVARLAARVAASLDAEGTTPVGPIDLGFRP